MDTTMERPTIQDQEIAARYPHALSEIYDLDTIAMDAQCEDCLEPLTWRQWLSSGNRQICSCGKIIYTGLFTRDLPQHQLEAVETEGYFERTWYHATRKPNWVEAVQEARGGELLVHAGSRLTALLRADDLERQSYPSGPIYLYSFKLSSTEQISTTVFYDMEEDWPEEYGSSDSMLVCPIEGAPAPERRETLSDGVLGAPYYNCYEAPGDISLIFHAGLIDPDSVERITL